MKKTYLQKLTCTVLIKTNDNHTLQNQHVKLSNLPVNNKMPCQILAIIMLIAWDFQHYQRNFLGDF